MHKEVLLLATKLPVKGVASLLGSSSSVKKSSSKWIFLIFEDLLIALLAAALF